VVEVLGLMRIPVGNYHDQMLWPRPTLAKTIVTLAMLGLAAIEQDKKRFERTAALLPHVADASQGRRP